MQVNDNQGAGQVSSAPPLWRRVTGGVLISIGALAIAGFAALATVVSLTFIEWRNPVDALTSVALVTAPPILAGLALAALGRWVYGAWRVHAPIASIAAIVLPIAGVIAAFAAIALFVMALFNETGRGGAWVVGQFVVSILASLIVVAIGRIIRPRPADD